jgi:peptidoglycan/LPS O-acetylase OafA/YrhL
MMSNVTVQNGIEPVQLGSSGPPPLPISESGLHRTLPEEEKAGGTKRFHEFDALRGFAMLLGIVLHGALSFTYLPIWPAQDIHQNSPVYSFVQHAIHGFRMPAFFLISGFFTAMMLRKRGVKGLVLHRAKRILLPLIVGTVVVWPLMIAVGYWGAVAKERREDGQTATLNLWGAARAGDLEALQRLINEGADVNGRDPLGVSPLEWAAMHDHVEAIELLAEHGAEVNARNPDGSTPLHASAFLGRTEATRKLIELGAQPRVRNKRGDTPLVAAQMDMGIVHLIAGMLQLQIDGEAVAAGRMETAAYLQHLQAQAVKAGTAETPDGDRGADQLWGGLAAVYFGATFFPVFHHLWFLYYLLWLVALLLVLRWVRRWIPLSTPRWMVATPWCFFWLVPLTFLPQLFMTQTFGVDTAPGLLPWPPTLAYYAVFFGFGALAFGRAEFEQKAGRHWGWYFLAAVPVLLIGLRLFESRGGLPLDQVLVSLCAGVYAWLMVFGLLGVFRRFFACENSWVRYLSDSSYWLYLAHLPLIIGLQVWVSNWDVHHFPKFLLVCGLAFTILIVLYEFVIRYSFIGAVLNGRKTRPRSSRLSFEGPKAIP